MNQRGLDGTDVLVCLGEPDDEGGLGYLLGIAFDFACCMATVEQTLWGASCDRWPALMVDLGSRSQRRLWVGMMKRSSISTGQLRAFRPLHLPPINQMVYLGTQYNTDLEGGFLLRCFQ